jgi:hypothetical protein
MTVPALLVTPVFWASAFMHEVTIDPTPLAVSAGVLLMLTAGLGLSIWRLAPRG